MDFDLSAPFQYFLGLVSWVSQLLRFTVFDFGGGAKISVWDMGLGLTAVCIIFDCIGRVFWHGGD